MSIFLSHASLAVLYEATVLLELRECPAVSLALRLQPYYRLSARKRRYQEAIVTALSTRPLGASGGHFKRC